MLTPAIRAILFNSCQLRAANVNSTLYLNHTAGESTKPLFPAGIRHFSALSLFMFFVTANDEQHALAPHNFAVTTDLFY
jgi:hypothetical protein